MGEWKYSVLWLAAVSMGLVLSIETTWKSSMNICATANQRPSTESDVVKNNTWLGKAEYVLPWGVITLESQRVKENETCSECGTLGKHCQFCEMPVQLNDSGSFLEELKNNLIPHKKYILRESRLKKFEGIPIPTTCLVHKGASNTEYTSCNKNYDDGCRKDDVSSFKVTISRDENDNESSTTYASIVVTQGIKSTENGSTGAKGPRGNLMLALIFLLIRV